MSVIENVFLLLIYIMGISAALMIASGLVLLWAVWRDRKPRPMAVRNKPFRVIKMWNL